MVIELATVTVAAGQQQDVWGCLVISAGNCSKRSRSDSVNIRPDINVPPVSLPWQRRDQMLLASYSVESFPNEFVQFAGCHLLPSYTISTTALPISLPLSTASWAAAISVSEKR